MLTLQQVYAVLTCSMPWLAFVLCNDASQGILYAVLLLSLKAHADSA